MHVLNISHRPCVLLLLGAMLLAGCSLATKGPRIPRYHEPRTAVLVLDMQRDFLQPEGKLQVEPSQVEPLLERVNLLLDRVACCAPQVEVVYIRNTFSPDDTIANWFRNGAAVRSTTGAQLDPRLRRVAGASFDKEAPDAFSNAAFDRHLRQQRVDHVVIAGVFADGCVKHTARGALNRGYRVTLLRDGVADASQEDVSDALQTLRAEGAVVSSAKSLLAQLAPRPTSPQVSGIKTSRR